MLNPLQDKKMLIESMKKLVTHVSNNPQRQLQIFQALSQQDLNKVLLNLRDQNQYLRRLSALLLCELFFMCAQTRQRAVQILQIFPKEGRICLGGIPDAITKYPSTLKRCLELMKTPLEEGEEDKMCWLINLERKTLKIELMEYRKYSSFTFIDPNKNIFGFTILPKTSHQNLVYQKTPDPKIRLMQSPQHKTSTLSSQYYKSFLQSKRTNLDSKRNSIQNTSIHNTSLTSSNHQTDRSINGYNRPGTAHLNVTLTPSTKREELRKSIESNKVSPSLTMSLGGKTTYGIDKIIAGSRQRVMEKRSGDFQFLRLTGSKEKDKKEKVQEPVSAQTDRIHTSTRQNNAKDPQRFYRRVKEILRK